MRPWRAICSVCVQRKEPCPRSPGRCWWRPPGECGPHAPQPTRERLEQAELQKQRVAEALGEARQALTLPRIALPPHTKFSEITFAGLPKGIHLTPGRLLIEFENATGLLEKLLALAQALANDFDSLEQALAAAGRKGTAPAAG
jgi:hypothetical protein